MTLLRKFALFGIMLTALSSFAASPFLISEFMANNAILADEDGDFSDWIEICNPTASAASLTGYYLTDDPAVLTKWAFPNVTLSGGHYLLVFASGKNRSDPAKRLHTNFQLEEGGEYLALVAPDGLTIVHQFAPRFPPQLPNVSYGMEISNAVTAFVTNGALAHWNVPLDAAGYATAWSATNFNQVAWNSGPTGLGFDVGATNVLGALIRTDLGFAMLRAIPLNM